MIENLIRSNNILINLQSKHFLERIGYIHDKVEKSLTFVYKHPTQGHVFSLENLESENEDERYFKQFVYLEQIFHMVYLIKKRDYSLDVGCCLYPYLYFQYYDSQKNLSLVDCIFTYCFSNVNNNFIRNLCGFFDSNNSDEIAMSCILLAYFFRGSKNFDMIKVLNFYVRLNDNDKLADFPFLTNNGQQMIGHSTVQAFIDMVIKKREKEKELYKYQNFYDDFKAFSEAEIKNLKLKINHNKNDKDMFYMMLKEKTDLFDEYLTHKNELEVMYSYIPQNTPMELSKKIEDEIVNDTSKQIKNKDESRDKIKKVIEEQLKPQIEEINSKIKPYFLDKINQLKVQNAPLSEIEKVGKELEEVIKLINDMNVYYKDYSILLQIDSEGNDFITKLELIKNKILPPLFIENSKAIINFPKTLTLENEINYLKQKPNFPSIDSNNIFIYVDQGNDNTIELFYQEMNVGSIQTQSKTIECEFKEQNCGKINRFPHECKWLTFKSFIFVTGGEDVDSDANINLVINLTKENRAIVLVKLPMQNRRKYHSMCRVNDYSFVVCGGTSNTAELFSVLTSKWTSLPNLNINRENGILLLFYKIDLY